MTAPGEIGRWGEVAVEEYLQGQGWQILHRRWHCRHGEIDLIARRDRTVIFVEVKTRRRHGWDAGGLLAVDQRKQGKLLQSAQLFWAEYADADGLDCRFDLALVCYGKGGSGLYQLLYQGMYFVVQEYITNAFGE
jgi:putative endonuclease